jgi:hypothetical protein
MRNTISVGIAIVTSHWPRESAGGPHTKLIAKKSKIIFLEEKNANHIPMIYYLIDFLTTIKCISKFITSN